jgi:hypothetical protein
MDSAGINRDYVAKRRKMSGELLAGKLASHITNSAT